MDAGEPKTNEIVPEMETASLVKLLPSPYLRRTTHDTGTGIAADSLLWWSVRGPGWPTGTRSVSCVSGGGVSKAEQGFWLRLAPAQLLMDLQGPAARPGGCMCLPRPKRRAAGPSKKHMPHQATRSLCILTVYFHHDTSVFPLFASCPLLVSALLRIHALQPLFSRALRLFRNFDACIPDQQKQ